MATQAQETFFLVPKGFTQHVGENPIPFYRPQLGHTLTCDSRYAVSANEKYKDVKALLENERAYIRRALLHAQEIHIYYVFGKNPVVIMGNFVAEPIKEEGRAIEAALKRTIEVRPEKVHRFEIPLESANRPVLYRIVGKAESIAKLANASKPDMHFCSKDHHVPRLAQAHAYLKPEDFNEKYFAVYMFEQVENITTSRYAAHQVTLRKQNATIEELFQIAEKLQLYKAYVFLRTHGTLRVTLPRVVDAECVLSLRALLNDRSWRIFTDTPLNVWKTDEDHHQNHNHQIFKQHKKQDPEVADALKNGIVREELFFSHSCSL